MKKIKLMLVALVAMMGVNAFAASTGNDATSEFNFTWTIDGDKYTAVITSFASGAEKAAVAIPVTVKGTIGDAAGKDFTVVGIAENAFNNDAAKAVVASLSFASGSKVATIGKAFEGCTKLATVDFTNATELKEIAAGTFKGTIIQKLDLSTTKLGTIENLLGTKYDATPANVVNNKTLTEVKLPATWETIATSAFENCTALATVNFGTAGAKKNDGTTDLNEQTINTKAFNGCPLTAFNLTGTKVKVVPANLLMDGSNVKENKSLTTVTLIAGITSLNASFANCTTLSSINIEACKNADGEGVLVLSEGEFKNDEALTSIDLSYVTAVPNSAFEGTGLTSLTFPKANAKTHVVEVTSIGEYAFAYAPIKTITFAEGYASAPTIGQYAFSLTQITDIKLPAKTVSVAANAFNLVTTLKTVTFKPEAVPSVDIFDNLAFNLCNDDAEANRIKVYTTHDYAAKFGATAAKFATYEGDPLETTIQVYNDEAKAFGKNWTVTSFGSKYYVKALAKTGIIKVKKSDAKVYAAYKDGNILNMQMFKSVDQYYHIPAMYPALIITSKADLKFEDGAVISGKVTTEDGSSFVTKGDNAMMMNIDDAGDPVYTKFAQLFTAAAGKTIYGWTVNGTWNPCATSLASKAVPVGFLYMIGEQETEAAAPIIRWLDEDGNVESEEVVTGIQNVKAVEAEDGDIYNLAGQKVNTAYKGVVIKNGKKMILK